MNIPKQRPMDSLLHDTANTVIDWTAVRALGAADAEMNFIDGFCLFQRIFRLFCIFVGSAETDVKWGGNLNCHLVISCVRNASTKNYQNLVILLQDKIDNVGYVFDVVLSTKNCTQSNSSVEVEYACVFRLFVWYPVVRTWFRCEKKYGIITMILLDKLL